jgi:hypothetical protein
LHEIFKSMEEETKKRIQKIEEEAIAQLQEL